MAPEIDQIEQAAAEAETEAQGFLTLAQDFAVATDEQYSDAATELKRIKNKARELDEQEKSITKPINDSLKRIRALFRKPKDFLADAERTLKRAMVGYQDECDRKRREEQRKADEAARKERERLERRAAKAAESGKDDKADALGLQAAQVTAPVIQREPPKQQGIATREAWKAEVTDLNALIAAAAAGNTQARACLQANDKVIGQQARSLKSEFQVPGIRVWSEKVMAA